MKKITALILCAIIALSLIACNEAAEETTSQMASSQSEASDESIHESSFTDTTNQTTSHEESIPDEESRFDENNSKPPKTEDAPYLVIGGTVLFDNIRYDVFGDGTVLAKYNKADDIIEITLNQAKIQASPIPSNEFVSYYGIYSNKSLYIELCGNNEIIINAPDNDTYCVGIRVYPEERNCRFGGNGRLNIETKNTINYNGIEALGIDADSVVIGENADLNISIDSSCLETFGIIANFITLSDNSSINIYGGGFEPYIPPPLHIHGPTVYVNDNAEMILRGNNAISQNNTFFLGHGEYLNEVYISEDPSGKNAKKAETIYDTILGASKQEEIGKNRYFRITARDGNKLPIWVGGKNLTTDNAKDIFGDGSARYDTETHTLTLDNAKIQGGKTATDFYGNCEYAIWSAIDLNIVLIGDNLVTCVSDKSSTSIAIYCGNLTVSGDGKLTAKSCKGNGDLGFAVGIYCESYLQTDGTVFAIADDATDSEGYTTSAGFYLKGNIVLEKGVVYAQCGDSGYSSPFEFYSFFSNNDLIYPENSLYEHDKTEDGKEFIKITTE